MYNLHMVNQLYKMSNDVSSVHDLNLRYTGDWPNVKTLWHFAWCHSSVKMQGICICVVRVGGRENSAFLRVIKDTSFSIG